MKRVWNVWGLVILLSSVCSVAGWAQKWKPTTKWPYLFKEFQQTQVFSNSGKTDKTIEANIHLEYSTLHYVDNGTVMAADTKGIVKVVMNGKTFIFMNGELVELLHTKDNKALVKRVLFDEKKLNSASTGAYGMKMETSASREMATIQRGGIILSQMKSEQEDGKVLPTKTEYFLLLEDGQKIIKATKGEVEKALTDKGKDEFKTFVKQNKIKWKEEESLIKVLDFFKD